MNFISVHSVKTLVVKGNLYICNQCANISPGRHDQVFNTLRFNPFGVLARKLYSFLMIGGLMNPKNSWQNRKFPVGKEIPGRIMDTSRSQLHVKPETPGLKRLF
jgi:hypothetical protein